MKTSILIASLALIAGLIFLAFKHPHAYRRVSFPLRALIFLAVVAELAWSAGVLHGVGLTTPYLRAEQIGEAGRLMSEQLEVMSYMTRGGMVVLICDVLLIPALFRFAKKDGKEVTPE
ncbi:MAG TPA: hypothetical protein VF588_20800 [Pyrinomonadaceae bacterium]|jgi:hypothetical protein